MQYEIHVINNEDDLQAFLGDPRLKGDSVATIFTKQGYEKFAIDFAAAISGQPEMVAIVVETRKSL